MVGCEAMWGNGNHVDQGNVKKTSDFNQFELTWVVRCQELILTTLPHHLRPCSHVLPTPAAVSCRSSPRGCLLR